MKIVNRCAVTIAPRQPFIEWAQQLQPDQPLPPGGFEPGLYLLPAYDSREEAIELLAQGYEEIFSAELGELVHRSRDLAKPAQPGSVSGVVRLSLL